MWMIDAVRVESTSAETMGSRNFTLCWNLPWRYLHWRWLPCRGVAEALPGHRFSNLVWAPMKCAMDLPIALLGLWQEQMNEFVIDFKSADSSIHSDASCPAWSPVPPLLHSQETSGKICTLESTKHLLTFKNINNLPAFYVKFSSSKGCSEPRQYSENSMKDLEDWWGLERTSGDHLLWPSISYGL